MEISEKQKILDNENIIVTIRFFFYAISFFLLVGMGIAYYLNADWEIVIMVILFVTFLLIAFNLGFSYLSLFVDKNQLEFRYYTVFNLKGREYRQINIPLENFSGFKIEQHWRGIKNSLSLEVRTKKGIAVYPSIFLSAFGKVKQDMLKRKLQQILIKNGGKS